MKILVQEFLGAPSPSPSVDGSLTAKGGNIGVVHGWLKHQGVGWVLGITDDASVAGILLNDNQAWSFNEENRARSWVWALRKITETICFKGLLCPDHDSVSVPGICAEQEEEQQQPETETRDKDSIPDLFQSTQFIQETMLKLLAFVDVVVALNAKTTLQEQEVTVMNPMVQQYYCDTLKTLLIVHGAMSEALSRIQSLLGLRGYMEKKLVSILSAKETKAAEAIWSIMEQIRMEYIEDRDDSWFSVNTQGLPDVHKATRFMIRYVRLLLCHYDSATAIVYVRTGNVRPLNTMIKEIASCLQEKLINMSESFPDHGFRFLFLLNNLHFIRQELQYTHFTLQENVSAVLFGKVEDYVESYVQVSWAPLLSCLLNPTTLCFGRSYSLLPKFESKFQKTYTTQKTWKVPDPNLRKTLRKAIIEKIVPSYTEYIEDNKFFEDNKDVTPKFSPRMLEGMLQELFEG